MWLDHLLSFLLTWDFHVSLKGVLRLFSSSCLFCKRGHWVREKGCFSRTSQVTGSFTNKSGCSFRAFLRKIFLLDWCFFSLVLSGCTWFKSANMQKSHINVQHGISSIIVSWVSGRPASKMTYRILVYFFFIRPVACFLWSLNTLGRHGGKAQGFLLLLFFNFIFFFNGFTGS